MLLIGVAALAYFIWYQPKFKVTKTSFRSTVIKTNDDKLELTRLKEKGTLLKTYINKNRFNPSVCFIIDMRIASGKKRFFVYDLVKDSIERAGLVTHGSGSSQGDSLVFSNIPESKCSSIGKYKIGKPYNGKFGLAYKLYGLDSTNSNVFRRFVVLHSHSCVPENEVAPLPICESYGCPTVSPAYLNVLATYIDNSKEPILLYIFYK
ncbi:murein L,D-transpeptidase catalytic domain family protein [Ferruginibacter albus]|nr:murein L,D-transpeptidase catalytic domain family protein [Ferruginibacter albus]